MRKPDPASPGCPLNHIFRAFLIEDEAVIRNIYSFEFFHPQLVINDVKSLIIDGRSRFGPSGESTWK